MVRWLAGSTAAALSLAIFFRTDLSTSFNILYGDRFDGIIETALLEHWFNVYQGVSSWSETLFFYPVQDTLGYNDGYFIFGLFYSVWRAVGLDPLLSSELTDIIVKLIGFVGFSLFATRVLRLKGWFALIGASIFTIANNSYIQGAHVQLFAVGFAPLLATIIAECVHAVRQRRQRRVALFGIGAAVFLSAWLLTAFYTAWFFLAYSFFLLAILALAVGAGATWAFLSDVWACRVPVACAALSFCVSVVPFLLVYLPKASETGMHRFAVAFGYLSKPLDIFNLSGNSLLYGSLQDWLSPFFSTDHENATGFTPILLLVFCVAAIQMIRHKKSARCRVVMCMALAAIALWTLTIRVGSHTPWILAYQFLPGAKGIRAIGRVQIFLQWPVTAVAMAGLQAAGQTVPAQRGNRGALLTAGLACFMLVEQLNLWRIPQLDREVELAWMHSVALPPAMCRAFFVGKGRPADPRLGQRLTDLVEHDIDAMLLAEWIRLPTINGFATFLPAGWNLLSIDRPDYVTRIDAYGRDHHIETLCGVNLRTGEWSTHRVP